MEHKNQKKICVGKKEDLTSEEFEVIEKTAKKLIPWRKGPFKIFG